MTQPNATEPVDNGFVYPILLNSLTTMVLAIILKSQTIALT